MLQYTGNSDLQKVSLGSTYTSGSGTMSLTTGHGSRLPSKGNFWIRTVTGTYQCFKVTARSTDTLTVTAAQDGTSDGNLSAGTELQWVMSASALDELRSEFGFSGRVPKKWDNSSASWINQHNCQTGVDTSGNFVLYSENTYTGTQVSALAIAAPTPPFTIRARVLMQFRNLNWYYGGIFLAESGSTPKIKFIAIGTNNGVIAGVYCYNNPTTYSTTNATTTNLSNLGPTWLKIYHNGTDIAWSFSTNDVVYDTIHTAVKTDFLTSIDQVGILLAFNYGGYYPLALSVLHWEIT